MKDCLALSEIQEIELNILEYVIDLCERNELRYFLAGGTLLGAIRHRGFIPWDNDVDISMPRNDYDKLIKIMELEDQKIYKLLRLHDFNGYSYPFLKVVDIRTKLIEMNAKNKIEDLGIYIDIFPIDGLENDRRKAENQLLWVQKKCGRAASAFSPPENKFIKKCKRALSRTYYSVVSREKAFERYVDVLRKTPFDEAELVASTFGIRAEKEIIEQACFGDYIMVPFEDRVFRAPIGYDQYLRQMYGDYMQLPPESEQIPPHDIEAYWRED